MHYFPITNIGGYIRVMHTFQFILWVFLKWININKAYQISLLWRTSFFRRWLLFPFMRCTWTNYYHTNNSNDQDGSTNSNNKNQTWMFLFARSIKWCRRWGHAWRCFHWCSYKRRCTSNQKLLEICKKKITQPKRIKELLQNQFLFSFFSFCKYMITFTIKVHLYFALLPKMAIDP